MWRHLFRIPPPRQVMVVPTHVLTVVNPLIQVPRAFTPTVAFHRDILQERIQPKSLALLAIESRQRAIASVRDDVEQFYKDNAFVDRRGGSMSLLPYQAARPALGS